MYQIPRWFRGAAPALLVVMSLLLGGGGTAARPAATSPFSDVQPGDYFYTAVLYLAAHGVVSGYSDGTFRPSASTTRGQLAKIIVLGENWPPDTTGGPHFADVPPGYVFYPYIETAVNRGILSGYADGTFRPSNSATRGQIAKIVYNALQAAATPTVPPPSPTLPPATATAPPTGTPAPPSATATATPAPPTATATATATPSCVPTWQIVPNPGPNNSAEPRSIAAVAPNDVWAVGNYFAGGHYQPLIEHWDGTAWSLVPFSNAPPGARWLNAVAAVAANDVWAAGSSPGGTVIAHWDGVSWALVPAPNPAPPGGPGSLAALTVIAADNIWGVGTYNNAGILDSLVMHWDGTAWTIVPSPNAASGYSSLIGVAAVSANDIWAVGGGQRTTIMHWDGTAWTLVPGAEDPNLETRLSAVTALASDDVWAAGQYFDDLDNGHTLIQHWDGRQWQIVPSPDAGDSFLFSIAAVTPHDIWAAGWGTNPYGLVEHWDGQQWSLIPTAAPDAGLYTLAVVNAGDLWAAGVDSSGAVFEHYGCP